MAGELLKFLKLSSPARGASAKPAQGEMTMGGPGLELTIGIVKGPDLTELWALMSPDGSELGPGNNKGMGQQLNRLGRGLTKEFIRIEDFRSTTYQTADAVYKLRDKAKAFVAKMEKTGIGKGNPIGQHAKGRPGTQMNTEVQDYLTGLNEVAASLPDVKAAWDDMFAATKAVSAMASDVAAHRQNRVVNEKDENLKKEKERADDMKKRMNGLIGIGIKIVSPGEWAEVAGEAAKFVGEQLVDQIPAGPIEEAETQLKDARTALASIEDASDEARVGQFADLLDAANERLKKAKILMKEKVDKLRNSQQGAVEMLSESKDTAGAAVMIQDRAKMIKLMDDARTSLTNYLDAEKKLFGQVTDVLYQYDTYPKLVSRADSGVEPNSEYGKSLIGTAKRNANTLRRWLSYLTDYDNSANELLKELADQGPDGFMAPFQKFDADLQTALVSR